jgi:serine/threonine protein kinase
MNPQDYCTACLGPKETGGKCHVCGTPEQIQFPPPGHLPPGTQLAGRYLIGAALGQGGFGITYRARDLKLDRIVAIKEYYPRDISNRADDGRTVQSSGPAFLDHYRFGMDRFIEEGRVLAQFRHPGIVSLLDVFHENDTVYIVMEYLDGITLREYLRGEGGQVPYETALSILAPVFEGMREVHRNGLIHRDISPDNILITRSAQVKLLDFGSSKHATLATSRTTQMILKDGYSPPEQYRTSGDEGPWTDVYALGATLYQAITGTIPPGALERIIDDKLLRPSELGVEISRDAETAILKSLAVSRQNRFVGLEEFQSALTRGETKNRGSYSVPVLQESLLEPPMPITGPAASFRTPATQYADSLSSGLGQTRRVSRMLVAGLLIAIFLIPLLLIRYFSVGVRAPGSGPIFATPASGFPNRLILLAATLVGLVGAAVTVWMLRAKRRGARGGTVLTPEPKEAKYAPVEHTRWVLPASADLLAADAGAGGDVRQHMYTRIFEAGPGESLAETSHFQQPPGDESAGGGGSRPRVGLTFFAAPDPGLVGRSTPIENVPFSIGRSPAANIAVQGDNGVSREHCRIDWKHTA